MQVDLTVIPDALECVRLETGPPLYLLSSFTCTLHPVPCTLHPALFLSLSLSLSLLYQYSEYSWY